MATLKSRAGAAELGAPLMILSFLMVAGFIFWLSVTAEPTEIAVVAPEEVLENVVTLEVFSVGPGEYVGKVVSLEDIEVEALFGNHGFWWNLKDANGSGYLLHLSDSLLADSTVSVAAGMTIAVTGEVVETSDSVLDAWEAAGAFRVPVDRVLAGSTYHLNFLEVTGLRMPETSEPGEGDDSGSDEGNGP